MGASRKQPILLIALATEAALAADDLAELVNLWHPAMKLPRTIEVTWSAARWVRLYRDHVHVLRLALPAELPATFSEIKMSEVAGLIRRLSRLTADEVQAKISNTPEASPPREVSPEAPPEMVLDLLRLLDAVKGPPKKLTAKAMGSGFAGLVSQMAMAFKQPVIEPEIRQLFGTVAQVQRQTMDDPNLPAKPEALSKAIQRNRNWPSFPMVTLDK